MNLFRYVPIGALLLLTACRRSSFPNYPETYREFAYVANSDGNSVTVLDLVYLRPDRTLSVGVDPTALAVNPLRNEVYVLNTQPDSAFGSLSILDATRNEVVATLPLQRHPSALSVDPSGRRVYIANAGSNSITVVDLDTRRRIFSVATGDHPTSALVSADGRTLVVTNSAAGTVSLYTVSLTAAPLSLRATFAGCAGATAPAILPDSSKAFVACSAGHHVLALSLAVNTATESGAWNAKQDPTLLGDHILALLDAGANPTFLTLKHNGGEVFSSNFSADSISEINTDTVEVASTYSIGNHPAQAVIPRDDSTLWVPDSGADSISLYSIDDGKIVGSLRTGNAPSALAFSADEHLLLAADKGSGDVALIRTTSRQGPAALFTIMPAGPGPVAIVTRSFEAKP